MQKSHDVDSLLILATSMAAKRRPAELVEIMAAIDFLQGNIPSEARLAEVFLRHTGNGLILVDEQGYRLSPQGESLVADLPRKADTESRLFHIRDRLSTLRPATTPEAAPSEAIAPLTANDFRQAIQAHRKAGQSGAKNLLMPKPKPAEEKARPGQRQRRPAPKARRRS